MIYPRVEIEKVFDEVVRDYGGFVLKEKLPQSPRFENADYVFHFEQVVAELKCLTEDNIESENNRLKTSQLMFKLSHYRSSRLDALKELGE